MMARFRFSAFLFAVPLATLFAWDCSDGTPRTPTERDLKVAFIGDQGLTEHSRAVLRLIRDEGTDLVIHAGDFDYADDPALWDQQISSILGDSFPYFATVGNHDTAKWGVDGGYKDLLERRLEKIRGASCSGEYGVNASCSYKGLFFILSGVGTLGEGHDEYLRTELAKNRSQWRVCVWHKNQNAMQVGGKRDETGWEVYETCREEGAIIATAHEHTYHRTKTLTSIENRTVDPAWQDPAHLRVSPGSTFVLVSGIAGESIRDQERCLPATYPYGCNGEWGKIFTTTSPASEGGPPNHGALFCTFRPGGRRDLASCEFKTIDGKSVDRFDVVSDLPK